MTNKTNPQKCGISRNLPSNCALTSFRSYASLFVSIHLTHKYIVCIVLANRGFTD
jgi:hypothetical protein